MILFRITTLLCFLLLSMSLQAKAKNIILFIGDGMGQDIIELAALNRKENHPKAKPLHLETLLDSGQFALTRTSGLNAVADSASSGTAIACGMQTLPEMIGLDRSGKACQTILEIAQGMGKRTGLVTDTRLSHATPAVFAAHVAHRSQETEIIPQLLAHKVNVLLGGGAQQWLPKGAVFPEAMKAFACRASDYGVSGNSKRKDDKNYVTHAVQAGYDVLCTRQALAKLSGKAGQGASSHVLGLFANSGHPYINDLERSGAGRVVPTVAEMTRAALAVLSQGENGFFLMVEGGQIDWALHDNDAGTALQELLEFDAAIGEGLAYAKAHHDTLVLVTADHATGGLALSYQKTRDTKSLDGFVPAHVGERQYVDLADFPDLKGEERYAADEDFLPYPRLLLLEGQKRSFDALISQIGKRLDKGELTLELAIGELQEALEGSSGFKLTQAQLARVLRKEKDSKSHVYGGDCPEYEQTGDRFYVYWENNRRNVLGKLLSPQSGAVFGTGTHSHVPVLSFAVGPAEDIAKVRGVIHNSDLFAVMREALQ